MPLVAPIQLPVVSPSIVIVLYSHVLATLIEYENTYLLVLPSLLIAPPKVPVKLERTQKDKVTVAAFAVRSATDRSTAWQSGPEGNCHTAGQTPAPVHCGQIAWPVDS